MEDDDVRRLRAKIEGATMVVEALLSALPAAQFDAVCATISALQPIDQFGYDAKAEALGILT